MHEHWFIPQRSIMEASQKDLDEAIAKRDRIQGQIDDLGIITRSKKNQYNDLIAKLNSAKHHLEFCTTRLQRYNSRYRIIRAETEEFGWRYPTWAEWPRDADIFNREATAAHQAKLDIMHFGRPY